MIIVLFVDAIEDRASRIMFTPSKVKNEWQAYLRSCFIVKHEKEEGLL
jgi:hypothetical protein